MNEIRILPYPDHQHVELSDSKWSRKQTKNVYFKTDVGHQLVGINELISLTTFY